MRIKNQKDFWAGIMFIVFGLFFAGFGSQYTIGTATRMGPGYFPTSLGVIVILIGAALSLNSLSAKAGAAKIEKFHFPTIFLVLGSVVVFGLLLKPLGLVLSLFLLVVISSYASHEFALKPTLINALALIFICLVVFVWILNLRLPLWPEFIVN